MSFAIQSTRALLARSATVAQLPRASLSQRLGAAAGLAMRGPTATAIGLHLGLLGELLGEMILRAVPKQRTSHSKKRKRMATKGLKDRKDLVPCRGCGRPKLAAQICLNCYHDIKRTLKDMKRKEEVVSQKD
ncbi:hypothetical protein FBU59_000587 [Linderina macrospora]|uniref:Uncharacterized protein n=1 Tax=Linderina macrospora TaxID=4868 RepID=A0ACC1JGL2_9FUNG|nr:hypothetical protein FBU59_000587 [Linderina macrospora]